MTKNKIRIWLAAAGLLALCLAGCKGMEEKKEGGSYEKITQEKAKEWMDSKEDLVILDVRTQEEYDEEHIPGAVCIPNETMDETVAEKLTDKDQLILVYCRSGNRSRQAAEKLADFGYTNVKDFGGIKTWEYGTE